MRIFLITAFLICFMRALVFAQTAVGTCDQYQPGIGGDYCINIGSATMWQKFTGDVTNLRGVPQCSPTNTSSCGKMTVRGLMGVPFSAPLTDGQSYCFNAAAQMMVPCSTTSPVILTSGTTVNLVSDGTPTIQLEYLILANNVTTINTPSAASMPDGKIIYLAIIQPVGNFNYTIPSCFTAAAGTQVYVTNAVTGGTTGYCGGTGVLPGMPTATNAELDFALHYRATQAPGGTPTLRVQSAAQ